MHQTYEVIVTPHAQENLRDIFYYICYELKADGAAKNVLNNIKGAIEGLRLFPARYLLVEKEPYKSGGLRKIVVKNYLVYFKIYESLKLVRVTAVVYSKRNQLEKLKKLSE